MSNDESISSEGKVKTNKFKISSIDRRYWFVIVLLGISGQIAWAVENTWFNTFVFDKLTPDPQPVAMMVAVSAITATVTTYIMGSLSDHTKSRWGRRKPYLVGGYIFWGIATALFPTVSFFEDIGIAVVLVIIADAIMTFFGSTANDAAYNAWITDITDITNRGRLQGVVSMAALIANMIALGLAGFVIDEFGYFTFFYFLGGIVTVSGLITALVLKEPVTTFSYSIEKKPMYNDLIDTLKLGTIRENRLLYLLFACMALIGIGSNISGPYQLIYFEHNLGFSKTMISIVGFFIILIGVMISLGYGYLSHHFNRKIVLFLVPILGLIPGVAYFFVRTEIAIIVVASLEIGIWMVSSITIGAWIQDNLPESERGKFQGIRMIFFVLIPMVIGPPIGSLVVETFGIPTVLNGQPGFIPPPHIFFTNALITLLALIPLLFITKQEGAKHQLLSSKNR